MGEHLINEQIAPSTYPEVQERKMSSSPVYAGKILPDVSKDHGEELLFTSGEVTRKLLPSESTGWTRGGGGGEGGLGTPDFKSREWSNEGKTRNTKKNPLGFKQNPKNSLTNFRRAGKDITRKKTKGSQDTRVLPRYHESSDCFEYPNKSPLKSSHPKKYLPNFPTQNKIPESKISNPLKSFDHPRHLNSVVPPPPPPPLYWGWTNPVQRTFYLERLTSQTTTQASEF